MAAVVDVQLLAMINWWWDQGIVRGARWMLLIEDTRSGQILVFYYLRSLGVQPDRFMADCTEPFVLFDLAKSSREQLASLNSQFPLGEIRIQEEAEI